MNLTNIIFSTSAAIATGRGRVAKAAAYYLAFVSLGLTTASLGPTLPGLAKLTHSPLREISFLFTARSLGYLFGSWLAGRFYDRVPGHPIMGVVLIAISLMLVLVPAVPLLWLLTVVLLVVGMSEGAVDVGGNTLLVWVYGHEVGPFMNGLHLFFGLGAFLSPLIIDQAVPSSGDISWAYWILAILVLPAAFGLLRLPSPAAPTVSREESARGRTNYLLVGLIVCFFFLYVGAEASFGGWIFTYALAQAIPADTAAYLTSAFWGAFTAGRLAAIPLAARFRPGFILWGDLLGCLFSLALMLAWPEARLATWLGVLGLGISMASIFPTTLSLAERRMIVTGTITGWFLVGASAGAMFLPWLIGQLFESIGPQVVMTAILVSLALALVVFTVLISRPVPVMSGMEQGKG